MRALTLWRPWTWAVCHAGKRIENRPWRPWLSVMGQEIALHAGKTYDRAGRAFIVGRGYNPPASLGCPEGIVAVARVRAVFDRTDDAGTLARRGLPDAQHQWFFGPFGWLLDDVRVLARPIQCRGAQGLWTMPPDVEAEINRQLTT